MSLDGLGDFKDKVKRLNDLADEALAAVSTFEETVEGVGIRAEIKTTYGPLAYERHGRSGRYHVTLHGVRIQSVPRLEKIEAGRCLPTLLAVLQKKLQEILDSAEVSK